MVMDIPFPGTSTDSPPCNLSYTVLFNNGSTASIPPQDMALLIPPPSVNPSSVGDSASSQDSLLPPFLCINSKITYRHEGQYHKGYLTKRNSSYRFSFKSHVNKKKEDWDVDLPNLVINWVDLCVECILIPGHVSHTFLRLPSLSTPTTFDPVASFVSAINLHLECPPSLLKALADSHPDREVWLCSFFEEKQDIQSMNTYHKITLGEYCALQEKGAPKAIPTMCVLTVKRDKNLNPLQAKSWIVVLGNHEDRVWSKCIRFAPVLCSNSLWFLVSLVVDKPPLLCQGDCKNAFCQGVLPLEEVTIDWPPSGDPETEPNEYWLLLQTLYGFCCSPQHWYEKINKILLSIGFTPSLKDPCPFTGFVQDPNNPDSYVSDHLLSLGLYIDDFVYFSADPKVEDLFCRLLSKHCKVDFMGIIEWFLGVHFSWRISSSLVLVHLNQWGFASNLVESFFQEAVMQTHWQPHIGPGLLSILLLL